MESCNLYVGAATMGKVWRFLIKLKIEFPNDPAIPLLVKYPDKTVIQKDTCTPECSQQHYSHQPGHGNNLNVHRQMSGQRRHGTHMQWKFTQSLKKNEIMPFAATWMELETAILSEVSQTEKEKYHMASLICGI